MFPQSVCAASGLGLPPTGELTVARRARRMASVAREAPPLVNSGTAGADLTTLVAEVLAAAADLALGFV